MAIMSALSLILSFNCNSLLVEIFRLLKKINVYLFKIKIDFLFWYDKFVDYILYHSFLNI